MKTDIFTSYIIDMCNTYILDKIQIICENEKIILPKSLNLNKYCFKTLHSIDKEFHIKEHKNNFVEIKSSFVDTQISK